MRIVFELDLPVSRGDFTDVPDVEINTYDSHVNDGEFDHNMEGRDFADFIYNQCPEGFFDGLLERLQEHNGE